MPNIFKKIHSAANAKTYRVGLLQAKAYRILKHRTAQFLKDEKISTIEWAFLGLLYDNAEGIRAAAASKELGVEPPFVSVLLKKFEERGLVMSAIDKEDNRAKVAHLTRQGRTFVDHTERSLRNKMRPVLNGASIGDILGYISVLERIIKNTDV